MDKEYKKRLSIKSEQPWKLFYFFLYFTALTKDAKASTTKYGTKVFKKSSSFLS